MKSRIYEVLLNAVRETLFNSKSGNLPPELGNRHAYIKGKIRLWFRSCFS